MLRRPKIAITMRLELQTSRFYLGRDYSEAIEACGGVPVHLALIPKREYIEEALRDVDGILLPGSNTDVEPHLYGEEPHHQLGTVIPVKDSTDMLVIEVAEALGLPILGICFGMQALNVYRGGTLYQDIQAQVEGSFKHEQGLPAHRNSHGLRIAEDSFLMGLSSVAGDRNGIRVNSSHHQAVKDVGRDLVATAWALDGIIECIEDTRPDRFCVGVQWHPELTSTVDHVSAEIFQKFIAECSQRISTE